MTQGLHPIVYPVGYKDSFLIHHVLTVSPSNEESQAKLKSYVHQIDSNNILMHVLAPTYAEIRLCCAILTPCYRILRDSEYIYLPTGKDPPDNPDTLRYELSQELLHLLSERVSDPDHGILIETYNSRCRGSVETVQPVEEVNQHLQSIRLVSLHDVA